LLLYLWSFYLFYHWLCFAKNRWICRGVSTSVERGSWPLRHEGTKEIATEKAENTEKQFIGENKGTIVMIAREDRLDKGFGSAKIEMQNAKLRQPDVVGMGGLGRRQETGDRIQKRDSR